MGIRQRQSFPEMELEHHTLGNTGFKVSSIGMGCVTFGREIDEATSFKVLDRALERGINLFDTAAAYAAGASETVLGRWLAERRSRDQIILASKVNGQLTRAHIRASVDESLQRLQTDRIDLYQLHNWDSETPLEEILGTLSELQEAGKVRAIGCSNWMAWQLAKALLLATRGGAPAIQTVQPPYNLVQREIEADLLPLCRDQNIGVIAYSPLAAGFLAGKYRRGQEVPKGTRFDVIPGHQPIYFTDRGYRVLECIDRVASESGYSLVQLALAWTLSRENVCSVLIGARNTAQVDQAFDARDLNLSPEILDSIGA